LSRRRGHLCIDTRKSTLETERVSIVLGILSGMTHHLVGVSEIATMLGVSRQRADQITRQYDDFPAPEVTLSTGRVWRRAGVERWIKRHPDRRPGRPKGG
jgi:predicted DNA-binding transcriptional regulator AlpA